MLTDNYYRLEFNESQQHFHLDNFTHKENTFGWKTIAIGEDSKLNTFIDYMEEQYSYSKSKPITLKTVLKEWQLYNLEENKLSSLDSIRKKIIETGEKPEYVKLQSNFIISEGGELVDVSWIVDRMRASMEKYWDEINEENE